MKSLFLKGVLAITLCLCITGALFMSLSSANTAHAATTSATVSCPGVTFGVGKIWSPGQGNYTTACDGNQLHLIYQTDGNLVLYCQKYAIWAAGSNGYPTYTEFQPDGNLVVYNHYISGGNYAAWATNTNGEGATKLVLQGDSNLVIYTASNKALWASGTNGKC